MPAISKAMIAAFVFSSAALVAAQNLAPPDWHERTLDPKANFYSIQREFYRAWEEKEAAQPVIPKSLAKSAHPDWDVVEIEEDELHHFKRWEDYMAPRVFPSGDINLPSRAGEEASPFLGLNGTARPAMAGGWKHMGPLVFPKGGGAGRLNFIRFHPGKPSTMYVGAPSGGLWVSTDGGKSWATHTDFIGVLGVADVAINPIDDKIMYIGTGDPNNNDSRSIGVLKSLDGGRTWNTTGLTWTVSQGRKICAMAINQDNPSIVMAGGVNGIWRTTDAGATWSQVSTTPVRDMEVKPGDPNIVYASGSAFLRSTNGGASFAAVAGVPASSRTAIAVTPANPDLVYALLTNNSGFQGFYRSVDGGASFSLRSSAPNIQGRNQDGSDAASQAWFDLALGVSPVDADLVFQGGINSWKSTDGGVTWKYTHGSLHTDVHALDFPPGGDGSTLFMGQDGGLYVTANAGATWTQTSDGISAGELYRLGVARQDAGKVCSGWQDNGTQMHNNGIWTHIYGGDGFECLIDWSDTNYVYAESQNGALARSSNGGRGGFTGIKPPATGGPWNTAVVQDPKAPATLYYGSNIDIWKSPDRGANWSKLGALSGSGAVKNIAVDPSNNQIIYGVKAGALSKSVDGGASFANITGSLPASSAALNNVAVDYGNSKNLWVCLSGYAAGSKVFKSADGGATWSNYSEGLPNLPANDIVFQKGSNGGVYAGMDVGVYYRENGMAAWVPFFGDMPNVSVRELEIFYGANAEASRLRAATFGRGLWESPLYNAAVSASRLPPDRARGTVLEVRRERGARLFSAAFTAARAERRTLEVNDLEGRCVYRRDLGSLEAFQDRFDLTGRGGPGLHVVVLRSPSGTVAKPLYLE